MQDGLAAFPFLVLRLNATLPQNNPLQSRSCLRRYAALEMVETHHLEPVHAFPLAQGHQAYNLADLLEEAGLEVTVLHGERASVSEEEAILVMVPLAQARDAQELTKRFLADPEAAVNVLITRRDKATGGKRVDAFVIAVLLPVVITVAALYFLWKALIWDPGDEPYLSTWRDNDLEMGIILLIFGSIYIGAMMYFHRKGLHNTAP